MLTLTTSLEKIVKWLRSHYPEAVSSLRPGLTYQEIEKLIQNISFKFPLEVYELYQYCNGGVTLAPDLVLNSLEYAMDQSCYSDWMRGNKFGDSNYMLPLFHGDGKDFYYVVCDELEKNSSPIWCVFVGEEPRMYAASLTNLILTIAECYETGAYYVVYFDEESGYFDLGEDLEKVEKIFQKYNPEQIDTWRYIWKDK